MVLATKDQLTHALEKPDLMALHWYIFSDATENHDQSDHDPEAVCAYVVARHDDSDDTVDYITALVFYNDTEADITYQDNWRVFENTTNITSEDFSGFDFVADVSDYTVVVLPLEAGTATTEISANTAGTWFWDDAETFLDACSWWETENSDWNQSMDDRHKGITRAGFNAATFKFDHDEA